MLRRINTIAVFNQVEPRLSSITIASASSGASMATPVSLGRERHLLRVELWGSRRQPAQRMPPEHLARGVPPVHRDPHGRAVVVRGEDTDDEPDAVLDPAVLRELSILLRVHALGRVCTQNKTQSQSNRPCE